MSLAAQISFWSKALEFIPNGTQTLSKAPERYVNGVYPKMLLSGFGCEVEDECGNVFIDYISSLGAIVLGYSNFAIDDAVKESIAHGEILLSLPHQKEAKLAERLCKFIPGAEKVKFFKTGSEATSAAVRLARAYTKKTKILACGYNGWHDWCAIGYDRKAGIPKELDGTLGRFKYNDLQSVEDHFRSPVAAIILEPMVYDPPKDDFLNKLISLAHKNEALVIFDEVVTGIRFGISGLSGVFDVTPDLVCMGKSMANGYPMAALLGRKEIMNTYERPDFFVSGTFGGDLIGISAASAVLDAVRPREIARNGAILQIGFNQALNDLGLSAVACIGYPQRTFFSFPTLAHKALFWQECVKAGILFGHCNFPTMAHGQAVTAKTVGICFESLKTVKNYWNDPISRLEGSLPVGVFA